MKRSRKEAMESLEAMLDAGITPPEIIEYLADVCHEKEEHVHTNWQPDYNFNLARSWHKLAGVCQAASAKVQDVWLEYPAWEDIH